MSILADSPPSNANRRATRNDVALLAGCSKTTVSFVLSGRENISIPEATRERVRAAAQELGYRPNVVAKALTTGKTNTISIVVPNLIVPHYARVLQVLERHSKASGHHLITRTVDRIGFDHLPPDLASILDGPDDGVILIDLPKVFCPDSTTSARPEKPIVSVGIYHTESVDCVQVDLGHGSREAIEHILSFNPKRAAFFGFPWPGNLDEIIEQSLTGFGEPRAVAYCQAMQRSGRPFEIIASSTEGREGHMKIFKSYVAQNGCPDAIFCVDDEVAVSAHRAIRELGFEMPRDVILVGCDGSIECEYVEPQISTIVQPLDALCSRAWSLLLDRLADPNGPIQHSVITPRFAARKSSMRA